MQFIVQYLQPFVIKWYVFEVVPMHTNQDGLIIVQNYLYWTSEAPTKKTCKQRQFTVEYYLHWSTMYKISSSGSSDTNHDSLL